MSESAKQLFESIKAMAPGLKNIVHETGAEMKRLGIQGSAEIASALFAQSNAYVPYGRGQNEMASKDHGREGMSR